MRRSYSLHDLSAEEFADLVNRICINQLGTGVVSFAPGKDGGRDGTFEGTAERFPSEASPLSGKFIIQAKWTSNPAASCSDREFQRIVHGEFPKIENLLNADEVDHYLIFTNRRKPAIKATALEKELKGLGLQSAHVRGSEDVRHYLDLAPEIWRSMGFPEYDSPFTVQPGDLTEVIQAFHEALKDESSSFNSAVNFTHVDRKTKNKVNDLSKEYDNFIRADSLPYFTDIKTFLGNPRNSNLRDLYHDTADELKQKIIVHRDEFERFDHVLTFVYDTMIAENLNLKGRRRYVRMFMHYMYYDCDIGQHAQTEQTS